MRYRQQNFPSLFVLFIAYYFSGCLVSFLYFRTITKDNMKKKKIIRGCCGQIMQFLGMVWYRYFRLTPVYLLVIGLIEVSMSWYYNHTVFDLYMLDYHNCRKFWWRNALYINTYFSMDERVSTIGVKVFSCIENIALNNHVYWQCIVWSWYLANDTLFYIIGAIILIISARYTRRIFFQLGNVIIYWTCIFQIPFCCWNHNDYHLGFILDYYGYYYLECRTRTEVKLNFYMYV